MIVKTRDCGQPSNKRLATILVFFVVKSSRVLSMRYFLVQGNH
jgi:hypothetical protein